MGTGLVLGLLAAGGLGLLFLGHEDHAQVREIWLEPGKKYYVQVYTGPGTIGKDWVDAYAQQLMSFGFQVHRAGIAPGQVYFLVSWNQAKTLWQLPDNVAIAELDESYTNIGYPMWDGTIVQGSILDDIMPPGQTLRF